MSPLSGSPDHAIAGALAWHARCMVLAWGLLLPLGVLAARFFKVLPGQGWPQRLDHKGWWHAHRGLQWAGVGVMAIGLVLVLSGSAGAASSADTRLAQFHAWAGWTVCVLGALQIASGLARGSKGGPTAPQLRGDHYDMTPWRRQFERWHKAGGWLAVVAAAGVMASGLVLADAPRWMALTLALWWAALAGAFVHLQRSGRCVDTYQAIWGPDPAHPGNRLRPIGWGVRRPLE